MQRSGVLSVRVSVLSAGALFPRALTILAMSIAAAGLAVFAPTTALVVVIVAGSIPFAPVLARQLLPRSPLQTCGVAMLVVLPLSPFFSSTSAVPSLLRFGIAGLLLILITCRKVPLAPRMTPANVALLAFVAYQLAPLIAAPDLGYGMLRAANWIMFMPLAFVSYKRSDAELFMRWFVLVGVVLMCGVVLQNVGLMGGAWGGLTVPDTTSAQRLTRFTSFLANPNDLGMYLVAMDFGLIAYVLLTPVSAASRMIALATSAVAAVVVVMTGSRGALLAFPVGFLVMVVMSRGRIRLRTVGLGVVAMAVAAAASQLGSAGFGAIIGSLGNIIAGQDVSASYRVAVWASRLHDLGGAVLGVGFGGYGAAAFSAGDALGQRQQTYLLLTVDSAWIKLLLEEGLVGVLLLASVFGMTLASAARFGRDRAERPIAVGVAAMLAVIAFRAISADVFDINPWNGLIWLLVGFAGSLASSRAVVDGS